MFAAEVARFCESLETRSGSRNNLPKQLIRSGTSVGANVEEAQAAQSRADIIAKYSIALKESRETVYWLRLLQEVGVKHDRLHPMIQESKEISKILGAIVVNTRRNKP